MWLRHGYEADPLQTVFHSASLYAPYTKEDELESTSACDVTFT